MYQHTTFVWERLGRQFPIGGWRWGLQRFGSLHSCLHPDLSRCIRIAWSAEQPLANGSTRWGARHQTSLDFSAMCVISVTLVGQWFGDGHRVEEATGRVLLWSMRSLPPFQYGRRAGGRQCFSLALRQHILISRYYKLPVSPALRLA